MTSGPSPAASRNNSCSRIWPTNAVCPILYCCPQSWRRIPASAPVANGKNAMLKEYHYDHLVRWPRGERAAVFLTFDFQGGEDVKPDKNGILNYEMWSQGEYGPHHAIYRLLRILKEEDIKATFLTCGAIADRFPQAVQAILDHGHVVEGHGYNHEIARYLPREQ